MPRNVKCQICGKTELYSERDKMQLEVRSTSGDSQKTLNKYYCKGNCWEKRLFIIKDYEERTELDKTIKEIHGISTSLPQNIWTMIQDIRDGTNRFQKFWKKKYKQGVRYSIIREAYLMSRQDIEWAKLNKRFTRVEAELKYCLIIAQNKIEDAYRKVKRNEHIQETTKATENRDIQEVVESRETTWKKQTSEFDISHILGDD